MNAIEALMGRRSIRKYTVEKRGRIMGLSGLMMEGVTVISSTVFGVLYVLGSEYAFYFSVGLEVLCVLLILSQVWKTN